MCHGSVAFGVALATIAVVSDSDGLLAGRNVADPTMFMGAAVLSVVVGRESGPRQLITSIVPVSTLMGRWAHAARPTIAASPTVVRVRMFRSFCMRTSSYWPISPHMSCEPAGLDLIPGILRVLRAISATTAVACGAMKNINPWWTAPHPEDLDFSNPPPGGQARCLPDFAVEISSIHSDGACVLPERSHALAAAGPEQ
jgi:hypothetical protein